MCVLVSQFSLPGLAAGSETSEESFATLRQGKELLEKGKYAEAAESLKAAYAELPAIRDYTLFFMAKTHNRTKGFDASAGYIDELLSSYPDSPLRKKARALRVRNLLLAGEADPLNQVFSVNAALDSRVNAALGSLEAYVTDYPEDAEMTFLLARLLKKLGKTERAKKVFILVYTGSSSYSEPAYQELSPQDITTDHLFAKASGLMKAMEYKKAETILRKILPGAKGTLREEVQRNLGLALFRQKRYGEASDSFLKAGDLYNAARSLFRAGELVSFREIVSRLASMEDKRAGSLLIAYAAKKRREGKPEESLTMYGKVRKEYPSLGEEALWGMAWTYYRKGDFADAAELFAELNEKYPGSRYIYWGKRSAEQDNQQDAASKRNEEPQGKKAFTKDFYSLLSYARNKDTLTGRSVSNVQWAFPSGGAVRGQSLSGAWAQKLSPDILPLFERSLILMGIGMKEEAVTELVRISNRVSSPEALLEVCRTLRDVGAYKRSITLISRLSEEKGARLGERMDINDILYPLAYWSTVSEVADLYKIDPFILLAVMREESRFDPHARSIAGALGLMQIMPQTAYSLDKHLKIDISDNSEIYNIRVNITIGAYYLNSLLKEFGSLPVALAAYNAGHDKVREWIKEGGYKSHDEFIEDIPYDETRNYVKRVLLTYFAYLNLTDRQ
jgi:soluble lytic murein transglycosylase